MKADMARTRRTARLSTAFSTRSSATPSSSTARANSQPSSDSARVPLPCAMGAGTCLNQPTSRALLDALADGVTACPELHTGRSPLPSGDPALSTSTTALAAAPVLTSCAPSPRCGRRSAATAPTSTSTACARKDAAEACSSSTLAHRCPLPLLLLHPRLNTAPFPIHPLPECKCPFLPITLFLAAACRTHA
ncbi:hypothetical protein B0H13DRAFT_2690125 [Mycena leptocephala]|nr:hypothetical protein B0H13DRAFT_2690125 [Mycena leptocephala]